MRRSILKLFVFLFSFSITVMAFAQNEKKLIKEAEENYEVLENKKEALRLYLQAHDLNPDNAQTNYWIGRCYLETAFKFKSLEYFKKAYDLDAKVSNDILFCLAQAYHLNHEFKAAIDYYEDYEKTLKSNDHDHLLIKKKIQECKNGIEYLKEPGNYIIENVGPKINSEYPDYAPAVNATETGLVFTSRREGSTGGLLDEYYEYYDDIYYAKRKENGEWEKAQNMGTNINNEGHNASIGLSADGNEIFIYENDKDTKTGDIFVSDIREDGTWSTPEKLPKNISHPHSDELSVTVSPEKDVLVFSSDREGGFGGFDLYITRKNEKGEWEDPVNLGGHINTPENEDGPFMDLNSRVIYFSSQGHKSMGGYDIFKSVYDTVTKEWGKPIHMGYPLNTADNDIYFVLSGDGKHGYFSSAREDSYGDKDIYRILMPEREDAEELQEKLKQYKAEEEIVIVEEEKPVALQPVTLRGTITDAKTGEPLAATVELIDQNGASLGKKVCELDGTYNFELSNGSAVAYALDVEMIGYMLRSVKVSIPAPKEEVQEVIKDVVLSIPEVSKKITLRNIYFDFDKSNLKEESYLQLDKVVTFLEQNPSITVEVGGHTDYVGSNQYNLTLSKRRAKAAMQYLVSKGVDASRLTSSGYGEEQPLASNDDEQDGRDINRRTEFKILSK